MKFLFDKKAWSTIEEGEKNCYLLANGLGGYHSLTLTGGVARGDQALFMSAKRAPNVRWHLVTNVLETLTVDGREYTLTSLRMHGQDDYEGQQYLESFEYDNYPVWTYQVAGVTVTKQIVMAHGENTVAMQYEVKGTKEQTIELKVTPLLRLTEKKQDFEKKDYKEVSFERITMGSYRVAREEFAVCFATDGEVSEKKAELFGPIYFSQDERDGREEEGYTCINHDIVLKVTGDNKAMQIVMGTEPRTEGYAFYLEQHKAYVAKLLRKTAVTSELGQQLTVSADAYVVDRASTQGKSILAGFPFFEDWGRDTMIAIPGVTWVTGRFEDCKNMLRTFAKYEKKGLLPNLFPEGGENPMYNSVDAPLLFVNTVYSYVKKTGDTAFIGEMFPVLQEIMEGYKNGTDFHIGMDEDGLIRAGADLEQLTWMDVRVDDHLPTPRHGKPVEINAYWYSALKAMEEMALQLGNGNDPIEQSVYQAMAGEYADLAEKVKDSFCASFWNEEEDCLKDVLSGTEEENQIRCNQIWALTQPFTMLDADKEKKVIEKVREELYTTIGLRTLSPKDSAFHEIYIGPMQQRDRAYHQGTVWAFPLGAYYRACIRYMAQYEFPEKEEWKQQVAAGMEALKEWLQEGCIGQVAEIYDGLTPTISRGCYAQAWSVGELLLAVYEWERNN